MVYEFIGLDGNVIRTADEAIAFELIDALDDLDDDTNVAYFNPASNGADTVYRSPEEEEKDRCYSAWGYR